MNVDYDRLKGLKFDVKIESSEDIECFIKEEFFIKAGIFSTSSHQEQGLVKLKLTENIEEEFKEFKKLHRKMALREIENMLQERLIDFIINEHKFDSKWQGIKIVPSVFVPNKTIICDYETFHSFRDEKRFKGLHFKKEVD